MQITAMFRKIFWVGAGSVSVLELSIYSSVQGRTILFIPEQFQVASNEHSAD